MGGCGSVSEVATNSKRKVAAPCIRTSLEEILEEEHFREKYCKAHQKRLSKGKQRTSVSKP